MCETINISVVVPLYNKEQSVVKTMECILAQTYPPIEVLIINDGSTDNSPSVVEDFIFRNNLQKTWSLIRKPNGGVSSARNRGFKRQKEIILHSWMRMIIGNLTICKNSPV